MYLFRNKYWDVFILKQIVLQLLVCPLISLKDKSKARGDFWHDFR